jgi:hypothetical protein
MALLFFHIIDGSRMQEDAIGTECPDKANIRDIAKQGARDIVSDAARLGGPLGLHRKFRVAADTGEVLFELTFSDAVVP